MKQQGKWVPSEDASLIQFVFFFYFFLFAWWIAGLMVVTELWQIWAKHGRRSARALVGCLQIAGIDTGITSRTGKFASVVRLNPCFFESRMNSYVLFFIVCRALEERGGRGAYPHRYRNDHPAREGH
jgi:hypothetical protein